MGNKLNILGLQIDRITFSEALDKVMDLGRNHIPSYVCFANVHMNDEARNDAFFAQQVNNATLVLPDGKPLAQCFRLLYNIKQERVAGMDFFPAMIDRANREHSTVFLYGSTSVVLHELECLLRKEYPQIRLGGSISPPFRPLTDEEVSLDIERINQSGAEIVFVSLGCPKQEKWMANNSARIKAVLLGVGGAFPVMAGLTKRAPSWMQQLALEWLYRLIQEPRRMFKRYLLTNSRFIRAFTGEYLKKILK